MKARVSPEAALELPAYEAEAKAILATAGLRVISAFALIVAIVQLSEANGKIWVLESAMRAGRRPDGSDVEGGAAEVGKTSLEIRDINRLRVRAKRDIDEMYGELPDVKVDHASEQEAT